MASERILWADDEIDLLKPHVLFLEQKGYHVTTVNNGAEAIERARDNFFDIVFLDENMPGINGLSALQKIKDFDPTLPVVMITKSEEEHIMEDAIGSKIADYLIKPVNPNQIKLVRWSMELSDSQDEGMAEIFRTQRIEANEQFAKFIKNNYISWLKNATQAPTMSHTLFKNKVAPILKEAKDTVFLVVIDNLRFDQWRVIQPKLKEYFRPESEDIFYSILPTATHYARNALFAGLMRRRKTASR